MWPEAILAIADLFSIDPHIIGRLNSLEIDKNTVVISIEGIVHCECLSIKSHWTVIYRNTRNLDIRIVLELPRHYRIAIKRSVPVSPFIGCPASRNIDCAPSVFWVLYIITVIKLPIEEFLPLCVVSYDRQFPIIRRKHLDIVRALFFKVYRTENGFFL